MYEENQKLKVIISELTNINISQKKEIYRLNGLEFSDRLNETKVNYRNDIINLRTKKETFNEEEFKIDVDKLAETPKESDQEMTDVSGNVSFRIQHPEIVKQSDQEMTDVKSAETHKIVKIESKAVMGKGVTGGRAFTKAELVQQRINKQDKNLRRWNRWKENKRREDGENQQ